MAFLPGRRGFRLPTVQVPAWSRGPSQLAQYLEPRHLEVLVNEDLIAEYYVRGTETYEMPPFALAAQEWVPIRFHVPEGCEKPSEVIEGSEDGRGLGMLFQRIS